jgi:N-acetylglutamate synthase-like GNAT family acetyltransferase
LLHSFEDKVIGVLLLKIINADVLKMKQVAVHPEWQNKGVGRQLVQFSEEFARKNNYKTIELHARDTAKAFYLALQYNIIGEEFEEVGIPHV